MLGLLGLLTQTGVLPLLTPNPHERRDAYLKRLSETPGPFETHARFSLERYEPNVEPADNHPLAARFKAEFTITAQANQPLAYSCSHLQEPLSALHPYLLGSLLYHLSDFSEKSWPIFTGKDAVDIARQYRFDYCSEEQFWDQLREEMAYDADQPLTEEELRNEAASRGGSPRELYERIGLDEVTPILDRTQRLDLQTIKTLATTRNGAAATFTLEVVELLEQLQALNTQLGSQERAHDEAFRTATGEVMRSPFAVLSAQPEQPDGAHLHETQELLEELWQDIAQTEGFMDNFLVRVGDVQDAQHAAEQMKAADAALGVCKQLLTLFIDELRFLG